MRQGSGNDIMLMQRKASLRASKQQTGNKTFQDCTTGSRLGRLTCPTLQGSGILV